MAAEAEVNNSLNFSDAEASTTMGPAVEEAATRVPVGISIGVQGRTTTPTHPSISTPTNMLRSTRTSESISATTETTATAPFHRISRGRGRLVQRCHHHSFPDLPIQPPSSPSATAPTHGPAAPRVPRPWPRMVPWPRSRLVPDHESLPTVGNGAHHHHRTPLFVIRDRLASQQSAPGSTQAGVEQNLEEGGQVSQSFNLLNRLGTNVSVLTDQPSAVETVLQPSVNEVAESEPAIANDPDRNQSVAEFFALFAEPFEAEETTAAEDAPPSSSAALPHTERAPESNNTMTEAEATAHTDPVGGESGTILETSLGSKSIAENLRELKEMQ